MLKGPLQPILLALSASRTVQHRATLLKIATAIVLDHEDSWFSSTLKQSAKLQSQKAGSICINQKEREHPDLGQLNCVSIPSDIALYACLLRKCGKAKALSVGKRIHRQIIQSGHGQNVFLANFLLQMYGSCGGLEECVALFANMLSRDQFSWNFIIRAYNLDRQGSLALVLFEQMQIECVLPDKHIFCSVLSACASQRALAVGKQIHTRIVGNRLESNEVLGSILVSMYGKCGSIETAQAMFDKMPERSVASWTAMIAAHVQYGTDKHALLLFNKMQQDGIKMDQVTFVSVLSACTCQAFLGEGKRIHNCIVECGFNSDVIVANALVNMYDKCGSMEDACRVFDDMPQRDVVSWTAIIAVFTHSGHGKDALELFGQMQHEGLEPNKVTFINVLSACVDQGSLAEGKQLHAAILRCGWESDVSVGTALVNMYSKYGSIEDVLIAFDKVPAWDEAAIVSILTACGNHGVLVEGMKIHAGVVGSGIEVAKNVGAALVTMYRKCGRLDKAQKMFDMMSSHDVVLWNAMAAAYAENGQGKEVVHLFQKMQQEVKPDIATFISVLSACSHTGLFNEACSFLVSMNQVHGMKPTVDHYNCMVDLLGRAGQVDEAENLINSMPLQPTSVSWLTLLSVCRYQGDVKRAERTAMHVFELDPKSTAPYLMLLNVYAAVAKNDGDASTKMRNEHPIISPNYSYECANDTLHENVNQEIYSSCRSE